jgi:dimethylglycine dehydrogenase
MSYSVGQVHKYSVKFYKELEEETGMNVGLRKVSNIRLASTADRWDEYMQYAGVADTIGVDVRRLTPAEIKEAWPMCNTEGLIGAIQHPEDGYIQPADLTQAMAKGARDMGGTIHRNTTVQAINKTASGEWEIVTDKGTITCEHVVSCTGNFARKTGAMVGLNVPVIPVEHQYIVTEAHPEIKARHAEGLPEMGVLRDSDNGWYLREEAGGLILGPYEHGAPACYVDGPSEDSEYELFQEDLERIEQHIESAMFRVPAFGEVGVKRVYNGAIAYTPDGNPIIGPAPGLKNFWLSEGHSFGITAAGGAGWQLAEWMVEGEPTIDMSGVDPRRYGNYATESYLIEKNEEAYANVFTTHYPDEEREGARPLRTTPCYDRMKNLGAVFGASFGWERPNWFAPEGVPQEDDWSFRRSAWFEHIGNEVRNTTENVGILDMSAFAKAKITGTGAAEFLDRLIANRIPKKAGRVNLCHALSYGGGVHSEYTIIKESDTSFYVVSAGALQSVDHDWIRKHMPEDGSVQFTNVTNAMGVLVIAGPKARTLMERVSPRTDFSNAAFPWLSSRWIDAGHAPTLAARVNYVGELGWELHHPIEYQNHIFDRLMEAGADLGIKPFGIRAMDTMRMEKSYRMMGTELSIEYAALEAKLDRFFHLNKGDFIGRDALVKWQEKGFANELVTMRIDGVEDADVLGGNPLFHNGEMVGRATSGNYGFRVGQSLALAMVPPSLAAIGTKFTIDILGKRFDAQIIEESPFDPDNEKLRA